MDKKQNKLEEKVEKNQINSEFNLNGKSYPCRVIDNAVESYFKSEQFKKDVALSHYEYVKWYGD